MNTIVFSVYFLICFRYFDRKYRREKVKIWLQSRVNLVIESKGREIEVGDTLRGHVRLIFAGSQA